MFIFLMEHYLFVIINFLILGVILYIDRHRLKEYLGLFALGLLCAYIFETVTTLLGFWQYHSSPKIPIISMFTWVLYVPYLGFCYFLGDKLVNNRE
jgi:hypothetical protein